tara:strand:+ start:981 stop:1421 length:441 start_codon:yes stop_codon:yes gene_type:complete
MGDTFEYPNDFDVYWEKWIDVYQQEMEEIESAIDELEGLDDLGYDIDPEVRDQLENMANIPSIKTIMTPFGMLPLTEQSLASSHFKLWVGHTNFSVLKSHTRLIGSVKGVESVDILTPYRFRIGIAKLFVDRDVMAGVRTALLESL